MSRASSLDYEKRCAELERLQLEIAHEEKESQTKIKRKAVGSPPSTPPMPGGFPQESAYGMGVPRIAITSPPNWGQAYTHLIAETGPPSELSPSLSAYSAPSPSVYSIAAYTDTAPPSPSSTVSSSLTSSSSSSHSSTSSSSSNRRPATPTSSISSPTRRSPLSTMRYADYPDIAIRPALAFLPVPAPHELSLSKVWTAATSTTITNPHAPSISPSSSVSSLPSLKSQSSRSTLSVPETLSPRNLDRRPSAMVKPLEVRKVSGEMPPPPVPSKDERVPRKLKRRKTTEVKVPGAYSQADDLVVEGHARLIFAEAEARSRRTSESESEPRPEMTESSESGSEDSEGSVVGQAVKQALREMKAARVRPTTGERRADERGARGPGLACERRGTWVL